MLKKYFERLTLVSLAVVTLGACDDDKQQPPVPEEQVTVKLTAGEATTTTLSFRIEASQNAEKVGFVCISKDTTVPTAEEIRHSGTVAAPGEAPYRADTLTAETDYVIAAAAWAGDRSSDVATLLMRTSPEAEHITATSSQGSAYYGNIVTDEKGTAQYHLHIGTIPFDEAGNAIGAGILYRISMHAAPSEDPYDALLATGTYTVGADYREGTFDLEYSNWVTTSDNGYVLDSGGFLDGTVTVTRTDGEYHIVALLSDDSGKWTEMSWDGPIVWESMLPGGSQLC